MERSNVPSAAVIEALTLASNPQGGWYRMVHESPAPDGGRPIANIINYLVDATSPISWFHRMSADAMHYFHQGDPLIVHLLDRRGVLRREVLGPDLDAGHLLQVAVPGGTWKAFELLGNDWALISEAVTPGWVPHDQEEATADLADHCDPAHRAEVLRLVRT